MTVYGTELNFTVPKAIDFIVFLDAFDIALEPLNPANGFYSVDAHVNAEDGAVLVGVIIPDGVDAQSHFVGKLEGLVLPALASVGVDASSVSFAPSKEFTYA